LLGAGTAGRRTEVRDVGVELLKQQAQAPAPFPDSGGCGWCHPWNGADDGKRLTALGAREPVSPLHDGGGAGRTSEKVQKCHDGAALIGFLSVVYTVLTWTPTNYPNGVGETPQNSSF